MEKGGKGYSSLNKGGSLKGKDDSAAKSAKGRRVQFADEGKGEKTANGGKSPMSKSSKQSEFGIEQELPKNIKCLMNCEAADILLGIQDQMTMLSKDPSIKIPVSFDKGLQYAKSNSHYKMSETVRSILEPLADLGVSEAELCVIGNVCPETSEEVYALIPSLKERRSRIEGLLRDMVRELGKLKKSK
ncbi:DNA-directed RNA polymerases IV and V subunit 4-like isoform X2 [Prosopis cineraria]|uniref:DNA-directed RNA polymerases IV and V subunit 4-like isoform X2 n=1 Tax=Prosopis cineraria TaxID=364024 RepID=UPI0024101B49|nr:DNA-directed RNA polymerases IV and V subunit 4-like isoform X2 [Prosopis cineraria]